MSTFCLPDRAARSRRGLTLIELVVVIAILAVLAAAIIPKLDGLTSQASSASDAAILSDINSAVSTFESRSNGSYPNASDGLLTGASSTTFYDKFHPNIQIQGVTANPSAMLPILYAVTLTETQAKSLAAAGITAAHYNTDTNNATGLPSDSGTAYGGFSTGSNVAGLFIPLGGFGNTPTTPPWTAHGSTFPDRAFNLSPFNYGKTDTFVVFGLGQPGSLRGKGIHDAPLFQSANPAQYYARAFMVFRIPGPTSTTVVPAKYVGAFAPDGSSLNDNVRDYSKSASTY